MFAVLITPSAVTIVSSPQLVAGQAVGTTVDPETASEQQAGSADRRTRAGGDAPAVVSERRMDGEEMGARTDRRQP